MCWTYSIDPVALLQMLLLRLRMQNYAEGEDGDDDEEGEDNV